MHEFVVEHDEYGHTELVDWMPAVDGTNTMIFRTEGDSEAYRDALANVPTVREFEIAEGPADAFYTYVDEKLGPQELELGAVYGRSGLVVRTPIVFRTDGSVDASLVGPKDVLQTAIDALPDDVAIDVLSVEPYRPATFEDRRPLTDRQREAVELAVDYGYYEPTHDARIADIAAELDCAPGTAAEHLRRAEAKVMTAVVD